MLEDDPLQAAQRGLTTVFAVRANGVCRPPRPIWPRWIRVGGAIAGAVGSERGFAEGFQQDGPEVVAAVPVGGQAAFDLGEQGTARQGAGRAAAGSRAGSGSGHG